MPCLRFAVLSLLLMPGIITVQAQSAGEEQPQLPDSGILPASSAARAAAGEEPRLPLVQTTVRVTATAEPLSTEGTSPRPFHATASEILPSAGTYGDFLLYLQNAPGVVGHGDWSNDLIVRGGNPIENLFLVDGIEVPDISQIAVEGSSGGLSTMIDTAAIQSVDLYTGGYDASYTERLSAVIDIQPREMAERQPYAEAEFGYLGAGGLRMMPLGRNGSLLVSGHRSFLNMISDNIGLGGTPVYSNFLVRGLLKPGDRDELTLLSLSGTDTLDTTPGGPGHNCIGTNQINMQYSGWRTTNGLRWRHLFTPRTAGMLTASDSEQQEDIGQQNQFLNIVKITSQAAQLLEPVSVYSQVSQNSRTTLKYDLLLDENRRWSMIAGVAGSLNRIDDRVGQPLGEQSSLSVDPAASDAHSFFARFMSGETASYGEITWKPSSRWSVSGGGRLQTFALGGRFTATPRLHSAFRLSQHTGLHAAFGEYAQMPPAIDMISWPQNRQLLPIRVRHIMAGADLYTGSHLRLGIEAYQKKYRDYPVSTEYPSLSLANTVDDLGTQILWLPLTSRGSGEARGVEFSATAHLGEHLSGQLGLAWSQTRYAGLDGVLRAGNFDYPLAGVTTGTWRSGKHYEASWRYEYTSGRPYTPFLLQASMQQNRAIYDTSKINAVRGPVYSRLDLEASRSFSVGSHRLVVYGGLDNAFNHKNFLEYQWMPRVGAYWGCQGAPQKCVAEIDSFSRYPDGGVRYIF